MTAEKMPCGMDNCYSCETCIYDSIIDVGNIGVSNKKMKNFSLVPVNKSTTQIFLGPKKEQIEIEETPNNINFLYCNGCEHLFYDELRNVRNVYCARCRLSLITSPRVIISNISRRDYIYKPEWCPKTNALLIKSRPKNDIKLLDVKKENKKLDLWNEMPGITAWDDIKPNKKYHIPPMCDKKRLDVKVLSKIGTSICAENLKDKTTIWFYKNSYEYKFFKEIK